MHSGTNNFTPTICYYVVIGQYIVKDRFDGIAMLIHLKC